MSINGFEDTDTREFTIYKSTYYRIILYQIELMRIIKILEQANNKGLAQKFRRILYIRDVNEGTKSNLDRKLPSSDVNKFVMSPREFVEFINTQRELDGKIGDYYGKEDRETA